MNDPPDQTAVLECGELVVTNRDHRSEILAEYVLVLTKPGIGIEEQDALSFKVFANRVIDDLRLILRRHTSN